MEEAPAKRARMQEQKGITVHTGNPKDRPHHLAWTNKEARQKFLGDIPDS